jgi:hypothetical protein
MISSHGVPPVVIEVIIVVDVIGSVLDTWPVVPVVPVGSPEVGFSVVEPVALPVPSVVVGEVEVESLPEPLLSVEPVVSVVIEVIVIGDVVVAVVSMPSSPQPTNSPREAKKQSPELRRIATLPYETVT